MFLRQISIEIRKTVKHPALWIGLSALLLLLALYTVVHHSRIKYGFIPPDGGLEKDLLAGLSFYNWIGGLIYAVAASVIMAYDYADLRLWLTRGMPRPVLLLARLTVILLLCGVLICMSIFATLGFGALSRVFLFGRVDGIHLNLAALVPAILYLFWSSLPYLALTVLLAVVSRSAVYAAGAMIVYSTVFEKLLLSVGDRYPILARYLPGQLALILQASNPSLDRAGTNLALDAGWLPFHQAILVIGIIFVSLCGMTLLIFSRQDLGG
jgi:ABC-type transport system involved in multi-copper enzyme maturation permease subunit